MKTGHSYHIVVYKLGLGKQVHLLSGSISRQEAQSWDVLQHRWAEIDSHHMDNSASRRVSYIVFAVIAQW